MKRSVTFQSDSSDKINLLIKVAHEMGINTLDEDNDNKAWQSLSEQTLAKDWLRPEEDIWDDFIKSKLKIK